MMTLSSGSIQEGEAALSTFERARAGSSLDLEPKRTGMQ
jgi:hypothetical protein